MEYRISNKMATLKPSAIREIFKYSADPQVIPLAAGSPAVEALPVADIQRMMAEVFAADPVTPLLYSVTEGYPPLREKLRAYLSSKGIGRDFDDMIITSGAQQSMDLACKVLCNEGDVIICEDPSFIGSLNCFRSHGVQLVGVPMQPDGMDMDALEKALAANPSARMIYTIPNFQNPSGITMSLEKRKKLYALAKQFDVLIMEDNPYGDLRFEGEPIPTLKSMDEDGLVVYAGTFSKILSPGIRVAYILAPEPIMTKVVVAKQCVDVHTSLPMQMLAHRFMSEFDVDVHIQGLIGVYRRKCALMLEKLDEHMPTSVSYTRPQGGMFVWVTLPESINVGEFAMRLVKEKKVSVVPGTAFCAQDGAPSQAMRLNFSTPTDEKIVRGIELIAELMKEYAI